MYVHENSSENLVKFVLAHCREDEVNEEIMYDDLCIKFGELCKKYRGQQHSNMIRTRLRELGKFIMEVKKMDGSIKNLYDILVPGNYDNIVIAINRVAGFDETSGIYRAPFTAYNLGLHIKTVTTLLPNILKKGIVKSVQMQMICYV
ncbi:hypothetical protein JTB14_011645 [Gonioctena quinquepunctata]|nr:hypothetical protein JTB14_011645 [Gonioctena quinquepunctata]